MYDNILDLQDAIKVIIERFLANMTPVTAPVAVGDTRVSVISSRRYQIGDQVVVYETSPQEEDAGEVRFIDDIPDLTTIVLDQPLRTIYPSVTSFVEKLVGGTFVRAVYIGDPPVIAQYPAITINARSKNNEWMTLESTKATYNIDIGVVVEAAHYESSYRLMMHYTHAIEQSLWRSIYPLCRPYLSLELLEDLNPGDNIIRVRDSDVGQLQECNFVFLESYDYLRDNRIAENLGNGVYKLQWIVDRQFLAGSHLIYPYRHIFNSRPATIQYGTINAGTLLKGSVISYTAEEEVRRFYPFIDSMTF